MRNPTRRLGARLLVALAAAGALLAALTALATAATARSQAAPSSTSQPTIEGTLREGRTVTAGNGSWTGSPDRYTYLWQRCDDDGTNCQATGVTTQSYALRSADVGHALRVIVTASNADGSASANSKPTAPVSGNAAPDNTARPTIAGSTVVGETLTANHGTWVNGVTSYGYVWQRCDANGASCNDVAGARGRTYGVRNADVGGTLRVRVKAENLAGTANATSDRTALVRASTSTTTGATTTAPGGVTRLPSGGLSIAVEAVTPPDRLVVDQMQVSPSPLHGRPAAITARFHVAESHGYSVGGALVYATGVPFARLSVAPEARTGADGWASATFTPTTRFPTRPGSLLVLFVRARKSGEDVLAGVSTRRLLALRIS